MKDLFKGIIRDTIKREEYERKSLVTQKVKMENRVVVVDIETSGLDKTRCQIVNIGASDLLSDAEFYVECYPDTNVKYTFEEKAAEINGTDPEEFAERPYDTSGQYLGQKEAVDALERFCMDLCGGDEKILLAGQNISSFDAPILCRTQQGNMNLQWAFGYHFLEIGTLGWAATGQMSAVKIADALQIDREDKLHTGIGGSRHEKIVLTKLLEILN